MQAINVGLKWGEALFAKYDPFFPLGVVNYLLSKQKLGYRILLSRELIQVGGIVY